MSTVSTTFNRGSGSITGYQPDVPTSDRTTQVGDSRFPDATASYNSVVSNLILSSSIYKEALKVLSADREYGTQYLSLLRMIPYSHEVRDENFWDSVANYFGGTSGYDKAVTDAFNSAMDEIRSLMQDYYSFLSKLPVEQVDQLRDAGINASITGEGVSPSSITSPDPSGLISPNPSQSEYDNTFFSQGVSSFVEFINSMANLGSISVNSENLLGLLDLAQREGYSKQELHDLLLANQGVTTNSPYRVLNPENTPAISVLSETASSEQKVKSAQARASADALESNISVNIGNDPDNFETYEIKTGQDWLTEISRYQIANRFGNVMIQNLRSQGQQMYAGVLSLLEGEYNLANFNAQTQEANFNADYFSSRNGVLEGQSQTDMNVALSHIKQAEESIISVEEWFSDYRSRLIEHWGDQLERRPYLAPYFYKAMFDFDMEDTFYHQNSASMGLKYGLQSIDAIGNFLGHLTGFKRLPIPKKGATQNVVTRGRNGKVLSKTTFTED